MAEILRFINEVIRTFFSFSAGFGTVTDMRFITMSLLVAILWISIFLWAGPYSDNLPTVKANFQVLIFGVIFLSVLPIFFELYKAQRRV